MINLLNSSPKPPASLTRQTCQLALGSAPPAVGQTRAKTTYRPIPMFRRTGTCLAKVRSRRRSGKRLSKFGCANWRPVRHTVRLLLPWPWVHCKTVPIRTCEKKKEKRQSVWYQTRWRLLTMMITCRGVRSEIEQGNVGVHSSPTPV